MRMGQFFLALALAAPVLAKPVVGEAAPANPVAP